MNKTIMVVDDNDEVRYLVDCALKNRGYIVSSFSDSRSAITAIEGGADYDAIMIDFGSRETIRDMTSGETVAEVSRASNPRAPRICISGQDTQDLRWRCFFDRRLDKPFGVDELSDLVSSCLNP